MKNKEEFIDIFYEDIGHYPYILFLSNKDVASISLTITQLPWSLVVTDSMDRKLLNNLFATKERTCRLVTESSQLINLPPTKRDLAIFSVQQEFNSIAEQLRHKSNIRNGLSYIARWANRQGKFFFTRFDFSQNIYEEILQFVLQVQNKSCVIFGDSSKIEEGSKSVLDAQQAIFVDQFIDVFLGQTDTAYSYDNDGSNNVRTYFINGKRITKDSSKYVNTDVNFFFLYENLLEGQAIANEYISRYFYKFLKNSASTPQWYGFKHKFNYPRNHDKKILSEVTARLDGKRKNDSPILLTGQSGSGKTIAIENLAYHVFLDRKFPVVWICADKFSQSKRLPAWTNQLDKLIESFEQDGCHRTLVLWDLSLYESELSSYYDVFRFLENRGRKIVFICTAYECEDSRFDLEKCNVHVDIDSDKSNLHNYLKEFSDFTEHEIEAVLNRAKHEKNNSFFALLYQSFYMLRPAFERGIRKEAVYSTTAYLQEFANNDAPEETAMQYALRKAGFVIPDRTNITQNAKMLEESVNNLLILTAVCCSFNERIPASIALRILPDFDLSMIKKVTKIPFFFYEYQDNKDYTFTLRSRLEAEILLKSFGLGPGNQIDKLILFIKALDGTPSVTNNLEITTIVNLLRKIGPNSSFVTNNAYIEHYAKIIDALQALHKSGTLVDKRLVLQEVNYIREYTYYQYKKGLIDSDKFSVTIYNAIKIADESLVTLDDSDNYYHMLKVEQANARLKLFELDKNKYFPECKRAQLDAEDVFKVIDDDYSYNIWLKASIAECKYSEGNFSTLLARICSVIDRMQTENPYLKNDRYFQPLVAEAYSLLGSDRVQEYFDELITQDNAIGVYLKAKRYLQKSNIFLYEKHHFSPDEINALQHVVSEILCHDKNCKLTMKDMSCIELLLQLKWGIYNKCPVFTNERQYTSMTREQWEKLDALCMTYINLYEQTNTEDSKKFRSFVFFKYIHALCRAELGDCTAADTILREIRDDSDSMIFNRRATIRHIICDENGKPKRFSGFIRANAHTQNDYSIFIDEIHDAKHYVHFNKYNLGNLELKDGSLIDDFALGVGYMGFSVFYGI